MDIPRKIVLILGNGFDLDRGLKTSYKDFWESEYCPKDYPAPLINHLNQCWPDNLESVKWYDLENELLNYYHSIPDPIKGMDHITEEEKGLLKNIDYIGFTFGKYEDKLDIVRSLVDKGVLLYRHPGHIDDNYVKDTLQSPIWRDRKALTLIKDGLCKYLQSICEQPIRNHSVAQSVLFAAECARRSGNSLKVYSFNYTPLNVFYDNDFTECFQYVHGNCGNGKIIIGTGDDGELAKTYDFIQKSFDSNYNPPAIVADLLEADEVIIFGHSIGGNDRQYFKSFFKRQTDYGQYSSKDITIFTLDDNSEIDIKRSLQKMTDSNLSTLWSINNFEIIKTSTVHDNPELLRTFLAKYISDPIQLTNTIDNLSN